MVPREMSDTTSFLFFFFFFFFLQPSFQLSSEAIPTYQPIYQMAMTR